MANFCYAIDEMRDLRDYLSNISMDLSKDITRVSHSIEDLAGHIDGVRAQYYAGLSSSDTQCYDTTSLENAINLLSEQRMKANSSLESVSTLTMYLAKIELMLEQCEEETLNMVLTNK